MERLSLPEIGMHTPGPADAGAACAPQELIARIGHMVRGLHDGLRELGLRVLIEDAVQAMPDARDRLAYVARMTEEAASRVLNATDVVSPLQDRIDGGAAELAQRWRDVLDGVSRPSDYRDMAQCTLDYLTQTRQDAAEVKAQVMEIVLAQAFQDLTGQVIKRLTELARDTERRLVQLLLDQVPPPRRELGSGLLNGPQIAPETATDVVSGQAQVDELLESLGF